MLNLGTYSATSIKAVRSKRDSSMRVGLRLVREGKAAGFFTAGNTGFGLADDRGKGFIDRLRSLPMARSAVLVGRVAADAVSNVAGLTIIVLVGAELNAEIEHQTARDTTVGPEKPLGGRGAVMADTVGAAEA